MPNFCFDCQKKIKPVRYFMVHDPLWEEFGVGRDFLCVDCFEKRLGRKLNKSDLTKCFVNEKVNPYTINILRES